MAIAQYTLVTKPAPTPGQAVGQLALFNPDGTPLQLGSTPYVLPAAAAGALGGVKLAAAVADVAAGDAAAAAGATPTQAEFAAVVGELNETKAQLNAALAALRASGALATA